MNIVITNDDGFGEPGLETLYNAVSKMGEVFIIAPREAQSGVGHQVTLNGNLHGEKIDSNKYIVDGSPVDCVRLALKVFAPSAEWLISGINPGANLGTDVYPSGTVAAAREAAILGFKAIAVSQFIARDQMIDWHITGHHVSEILSIIMTKNLSIGQFWNINLPHPIESLSTLEYKYCALDKHSQDYIFKNHSDEYEYEGSIYDRPFSIGSDVDVCFGGKISVTLMEI
jgi:5'-nucleotidase